MKPRNKLVIYAIPVIIVLAGLTIYQYGYLNARQEIMSLRDTNAARTRTLIRCMEMIGERANLEKKLEALREKRKEDTSKTIEAQTPSLCAAALQEMVKGIITGQGGSITSERVEKTENLGKFRVIGISIDTMLPDTRALSDLLFGIETRTPYIVVRELDVRVKNFRDPRELVVKLRLSALARGE